MINETTADMAEWLRAHAYINDLANERFAGMGSHGLTAKCCREIAERLEELEAKQPRWTTADDPPKEAGNYLVALSDKERRAIKAAHYNADYGWIFETWEPGSVTYWMPLPEPPKEDGYIIRTTEDLTDFRRMEHEEYMRKEQTAQ